MKIVFAIYKVFYLKDFSVELLVSQSCVHAVNKFSLTSLLSRVYSQQVSLDKFTFSCVQSTSFP